jgi:hypothetical protein
MRRRFFRILKLSKEKALIDDIPPLVMATGLAAWRIAKLPFIDKRRGYLLKTGPCQRTIGKELWQRTADMAEIKSRNGPTLCDKVWIFSCIPPCPP